MAKIAVGSEEVRGTTRARLLARGEGWTVEDVVCTRGPRDRPFEERHTCFRIAIVTAGTFHYRGERGGARRNELMTPGSLLLGNERDCFQCGHEHGTGDRCVSFGYAPEYLEGIAADAGMRGAGPVFSAARVPPLRALSPLVARACSAVAASTNVSWEELGLELAAQTVRLVRSVSGPPNGAPPGAAARVPRAVHRMEERPDADATLGSLAQDVKMSPYHFLRMFRHVTGVTPHQYMLRLRLRRAALRLAAEPAKITDIALECGFGDLSNFNHAFRSEFGMSPRAYRRGAASAG